MPRSLDHGPANARYDLAVIGAGSAGFSAAITAAELGAHVALIGHGTIGGTCVNVGCVPSKALIRAADAVHAANTASRFAGVSAEGRIKDWGALRRQKDDLVGSLRQAKYIDLLPLHTRIAYLEGTAGLAPGGVSLDGGHIAAEKIIIATGSRALVPAIPGIAHIDCLTSTTALELDGLPESMIVLGGGYIGCELAQMFARAGSKVTIVFRSRLLPDGEPEISNALAACFGEEGIRVQRVDSYDLVERTKSGVALWVRIGGKARKLTSERLVVAAGRVANTSDLGLSGAGVEVVANGAIKVDGHLRTTRAGVYAAGDVTGRDPFVYMAAYGGKIAARNALNGDSVVYDSAAMPAVVFTDPQVARAGMTEASARARGIDVKTSLLTLDNVARALVARDTRGLIKLVADAGTDRLIGAHILAPEGADSIQTAVLAIRQGMTVTELGEIIFPYLTTVEGLKLAAQAFHKDVALLSCCAG